MNVRSLLKHGKNSNTNRNRKCSAKEPCGWGLSLSNNSSDRRFEILVFGYIRELESALQHLLRIPTAVTELIVLFGKSISMDEFESVNSKLTISENRMVLATTPQHSGYLACFGAQRIGRGMSQRWRIAIHEVTHSGGSGCNLGIIDAKNARSESVQVWWSRDIGYSIYTYNGSLYPGGKSYATMLKKGDIVDIYLDWLPDSNGSQLRYEINEQECPVAFDRVLTNTENDTFCLAVSLAMHPTTIELL